MKRPNGQSFLFIFLVIFAFSLTSCGPSSTGQTQNSSGGSGNKVAFVYKDKSADYNMSHLHELGRQYVAAQLPNVETSFVEEITPDKAEQTLRDLADKGNKLIFATDPEYGDAVLKVAKDFPKTFFEVAQGSET